MDPIVLNLPDCDYSQKDGKNYAQETIGKLCCEIHIKRNKKNTYKSQHKGRDPYSQAPARLGDINFF